MSSGAKPICIAVDAMGGDHAPQSVIAGAAIAQERYPQIQFTFFGDELVLKPLVAKSANLVQSVIVHTEHKIAADDKPGVALRNGRQSSMRLAIDAVAKGEADAVISSGNTGALMALSKFALKTLPGIDRPAIVAFFPTRKGEAVMLDLGANVACDAKNLVDFALMGGEFARAVLMREHPKIALLNVGAEDIKGRDDVKEAAELLRNRKLPGEFIGFVEGDDILKGDADVIVTDGFTGNVALKTAEGTAKFYTEFMKQTFRTSPLAMLGYWLAKPAFMRLRQQTDPRQYNGAMFVGLRGVCVKSHGGTDATGFANALGVTVDLVQHNINARIAAQLAMHTGEAAA